jgi:hypothetical protein
MRRFGVAQFVGLALCLAACATCGQAAVLVEAGQARAALVLAVPAADDEKLAAQALQTYIKRMSGVQLPIVNAGEDLWPVLIGAAALRSLDEQTRQSGADPASFTLAVSDEGIALRGLSPEGTLFAAYELLEQLGVRWFMPGELGTVVPHAPTVRLANRVTVQSPSFPGRWHNGGVYFKEWGRHVRMGGPYFPSSHGIALGKDATFDKHPEYYSLISGRRERHQLCVSNPEVVRLATEQVRAYFRAHPEQPWLGLGANDGSGFCECDPCRALDGGDYDPFSAEPSMTDRYVWFFNQILQGLGPDFADKKICFYAYHTYMRPPVKTRPDPRIVPALAAIALCRLHGPLNPVCPEKNYWLWLAKAWKQLVPEVYDRGYWFNLADPGFPFSTVSRLQIEIPAGRELGLAGWRVETANHWGSETPSLYLAAKLMWDSRASGPRLLDDFAERFFGPAALPMGQYLDLMDKALAQADYHTGCSWDLPHIYPASLRLQAEKLLNEAARQATAPQPGMGESAPDGSLRTPYSQRVRVFRQTFETLQAFIRMMEAERALDFAPAYRQLKRLQELQAALIAYDPPMINPRLGPAYVQRFFAPAVMQGYGRTRGGQRMVAGLQDEWEFLLAPQGLDDILAVMLGSTGPGGNWQRLKTSSRSWSDQGLRYYKGAVLYRQAVTIPAAALGQRLRLWFAGVDERATVWVNGRLVGGNSGAAFVPFECDITGAAQAGTNTVLVRVVNVRVDELGTGGLTGPVMVYAAAEGDTAAEANRTTQPH